MIWTNQIPSTTDAFRAARMLWGLSKDELTQSSRNARLVNQRWIVFALLNSRGFSHQQIADVFDVHSSTVTYGLQRHIDMTDEEYIENSDALVELHNQLIRGYDPSPNTSDDSYKYYPRDWYGKQDCPNMGGFSDYNKETMQFV